MYEGSTVCARHGSVVWARLLLAIAAVTGGGVLALSAGCESDDVGHHKTVTKETVDTPTERKTITETHEKDTRYVPK